MRQALRLAGWLAGILGVVVLAGLVYFGIAFPRKQDPPDLRIAATAELLVRGEYLVHHVAACVACHTPHGPSPGGPRIDAGRLGQGGSPFPLGSAGILYSDNITPAGLGAWSDGEIVRALRDGIARDGTPLFPLMPYLNYRHLTQRDVQSIVAYVRTLPRRGGPARERELSFPMSLIVRLMPSPAGPYPSAPPDGDPVERGRYLVMAASCGDCHSPIDKRGRPVPGREFSGGSPFSTGDGWVARTANITPDRATGIGAWSRERFVATFATRAAAAARSPAPGERLSPMPWRSYAGMTESDLGAIYAFLRTLEPVRHEVVRFAPEPPEAE